MNDWTHHEPTRDHLINLAQECRRADQELRKACLKYDINPLTYTQRAMRNYGVYLNIPCWKQAQYSAQAQILLATLHDELIRRGFDYNLVHNTVIKELESDFQS